MYWIEWIRGWLAPALEWFEAHPGTRFRSVLVREYLQMVLIANRLVGIDMDQNGHWSLQERSGFRKKF
jgi:hypothetical protein